MTHGDTKRGRADPSAEGLVRPCAALEGKPVKGKTAAVEEIARRAAAGRQEE